MRGREGLYGRPRGGEVVVFLQHGSQMNRDAGDHKGPPNPTSATLAPTDVDGLVLRLMPIGRPRGSPVQYCAACITRYTCIVRATLAVALAIIQRACNFLLTRYNVNGQS